jgi:hypothetical protein
MARYQSPSKVPLRKGPPWQRWRKATWAIVIFTALMGYWIFGRSTGIIGGTFLLGVWFVGFVILLIVWFISRPARRLCPVCGEAAHTGETVCHRCGHDFAAAAILRAAPNVVDRSIETTGTVKEWAASDSPSQPPALPVARASPSPAPCPWCGTENTAEARFCSECGTQLRPAPPG